MQNQELNTVSVFVNCQYTDPDILEQENPFELVSDKLDIQICRIPLFESFEEASKSNQAIFAVGTHKAFDLYRKDPKQKGKIRPYYLRR